MPPPPDDNPCFHLGVKSAQLSLSETNKESLGQAVFVGKSGWCGIGNAVQKGCWFVPLTLEVVIKLRKIFNYFYVKTVEYFLGRAD